MVDTWYNCNVYDFNLVGSIFTYVIDIIYTILLFIVFFVVVVVIVVVVVVVVRIKSFAVFIYDF